MENRGLKYSPKQITTILSLYNSTFQTIERKRKLNNKFVYLVHYVCNNCKCFKTIPLYSLFSEKIKRQHLCRCYPQNRNKKDHVDGKVKDHIIDLLKKSNMIWVNEESIRYKNKWKFLVRCERKHSFLVSTSYVFKSKIILCPQCRHECHLEKNRLKTAIKEKKDEVIVYKLRDKYPDLSKKQSDYCIKYLTELLEKNA